ncbi:hypothetical protein Anas_12202, partial [Armadillidium nasatum]
VSDPEELSSDLNGNAGHKPISRKMKLDDGVDTEDSFAVATSSAAMPKFEVIVTNYIYIKEILKRASKGQIMLRNYELYGKLEKVHRDDIVQILVDHCIEQEHFIMERIRIPTSFHLKRTAYNRKEPKESSLKGTGISDKSFENLDYIQNKILKVELKNLLTVSH